MPSEQTLSKFRVKLIEAIDKITASPEFAEGSDFGERDLPNETGLWMRDGTRWDLLFRGEWAIGWHEDTPIRCSHVEHFPRGGWSKAVPSAEIDRLRAECDCWRSKYEAALHDWRNTQTERDSLRAKLAEAEADLAEKTRRVDLAGGYHERTPREIAIERELNDGIAATESAERYLLELVDAGRNRLHLEIEAKEAAEQKLAEAEAKVGELKEPWSMSRGPNGEVVFSRGPERLCIWDDGQVEFLRFDGTRIVERYEVGKIENN